MNWLAAIFSCFSAHSCLNDDASNSCRSGWHLTSTHILIMQVEATHTVVPFQYSGKINELPSVELVRKMFDYDPETGILIWKWHPTSSKAQGMAKLKKEAGKDCKGYIKIKVFAIYHWAHRLAWLHYYGEPPNGLIDHINGNPKDNRILNLRVVDHHGNSSNRRMSKNNTSGFMNVHKVGSLWQACLIYKKKRFIFGRQASAEEAWRKVKELRLRLGLPIEIRPRLGGSE